MEKQNSVKRIKNLLDQFSEEKNYYKVDKLKQLLKRAKIYGNK